MAAALARSSTQVVLSSHVLKTCAGPWSDECTREVRALHEHAARTAGGVEHPVIVGAYARINVSRQFLGRRGSVHPGPQSLLPVAARRRPCPGARRAWPTTVLSCRLSGRAVQVLNPRGRQVEVRSVSPITFYSAALQEYLMNFLRLPSRARCFWRTGAETCAVGIKGPSE